MSVVFKVIQGIENGKIIGAEYEESKDHNRTIKFKKGLEDKYLSRDKIYLIELSNFHNSFSEIEVYTKTWYGYKRIKQKDREHKGILELFKDLSKILESKVTP